MAIVIISISVVGVLKVMDYTTMHSADPMVQTQAVAIAEAYLEEILSKSYDDPDGSDGESARTSFDDVDDYNGVSDSTPVNSLGSPITSLSGYSVAVSVATETVSGATMKCVDVTVSHATGLSIDVSGYRGSF
ncbi:pilus assembly protein MshD [Candidatus Reidiella endopervernicosa]|nr:pilus assembly protein MshD [Candidatus Reidiella endopervernicosa]